MKVVCKDLEEQPWAKQLLREIENNGGITGANKAHLFECRFAYALHRTGIVPGYEVTGEGSSTLDFGFSSNGQAWKVELMRLEETAAVRGATKVTTDEDGTEWTEQILSSTAADKKQSEEGETLKAVQRICQKCEKDGQPYKFPLLNETYHALLVDFRLLFLSQGDIHDRIHIGLGGKFVSSDWNKLYWDGKLISGVFDPKTSLKGASEIRERVHFLGFVDEENKYLDGGFREATQFIANPNLFANLGEMRAALDTWPLQPVRVINNK